MVVEQAWDTACRPAHPPGQERSRGLAQNGRWRQTFYQTRLVLGERMYRAGIDDGQLGVQIRDMGECICLATATQAPSKALKLQREKLILQLADAALAEEGPLPGADTEYQKARKAEAVLAEIRSE